MKWSSRCDLQAVGTGQEVFPEPCPVFHQRRVGRLDTVADGAAELTAGGPFAGPEEDHAHHPEEAAGLAVLDDQPGVLHQAREVVTGKDVDVVGRPEVVGRAMPCCRCSPTGSGTLSRYCAPGAAETHEFGHHPRWVGHVFEHFHAHQLVGAGVAQRSGSPSLTRPVKGPPGHRLDLLRQAPHLVLLAVGEDHRRPGGRRRGWRRLRRSRDRAGCPGADGEAGEQFAGFAAEPAIQHRIAQTAHAWRHRFARRSGTGTPALEQGADHAGMLCKAEGSPCAASSRKRRRRSTASCGCRSVRGWRWHARTCVRSARLLASDLETGPVGPAQGLPVGDVAQRAVGRARVVGPGGGFFRGVDDEGVVGVDVVDHRGIARSHGRLAAGHEFHQRQALAFAVGGVHHVAGGLDQPLVVRVGEVAVDQHDAAAVGLVLVQVVKHVGQRFADVVVGQFQHQGGVGLVAEGGAERADHVLPVLAPVVGVEHRGVDDPSRLSSTCFAARSGRARTSADGSGSAWSARSSWRLSTSRPSRRRRTSGLRDGPPAARRGWRSDPRPAPARSVPGSRDPWRRAPRRP